MAKCRPKHRIGAQHCAVRRKDCGRIGQRVKSVKSRRGGGLGHARIKRCAG
jgi:hypothetical protein